MLYANEGGHTCCYKFSQDHFHVEFAMMTTALIRLKGAPTNLHLKKTKHPHAAPRRCARA